MCDSIITKKHLGSNSFLSLFLVLDELGLKCRIFFFHSIRSQTSVPWFNSKNIFSDVKGTVATLHSTYKWAFSPEKVKLCTVSSTADYLKEKKSGL